MKKWFGMKNDTNTTGQPADAALTTSSDAEGSPESLGRIGEGAANAADQKIAELEAQLAEANSRALRVMADFQNYQRRALQNEAQAKAFGVAGVVERIVTVLDHFDMALNQDASKASAEQIIAGVRVIREELLKVLQQHGVTLVNPAPNDEFTPGSHEAIMQQPAEGVEPGRIVQTFQPGYAMNYSGVERMIRPAKVVVAPSA
ncbi:MAG: nucleotide exchange factor GrpE [Planctomycetota bacterium]|nr:nucleotide exchange factor GrpE [Planctomycetota bacterium]